MARKQQQERPACERGGDTPRHEATWETTDKAAQPIRYCERHTPANHAELGLRRLGDTGDDGEPDEVEDELEPRPRLPR